MAGSVATELVALAHRLADAARPIARRYFRSGVAVDEKTDLSPVTVADRDLKVHAVSVAIKEALAQHPGFGIERTAQQTVEPVDHLRPLRRRTFGVVGSNDAFARWQGALQKAVGTVNFQAAVSFARTGHPK